MKSRDAKCIATHKRPDKDALVSVWPAECYLFSGHPVNIEFLGYGIDVEQLAGVNCVVEGFAHDRPQVSVLAALLCKKCDGSGGVERRLNDHLRDSHYLLMDAVFR